jgi:hypothetical protein
MKKRELFPGPPPTSLSSFASPHWTLASRSPCPGSGILTRFPFDRRGGVFDIVSNKEIRAPDFQNGVLLSLRAD